ncbi:hypothetical protein V6N13_008051 [Hibiscus sabdariffa]|uniref:Uncharacterized protein n=1 Tax=Hibiscus sabdariffa TaxID=183260 RepID=A0ABR2EC43_9ROSI
MHPLPEGKGTPKDKGSPEDKKENKGEKPPKGRRASKRSKVTSPEDNVKECNGDGERVVGMGTSRWRWFII